MSDLDAVDGSEHVSRRTMIIELEESPRNHGPTFKFHVLFKDLFNPLTENLKKTTGPPLARGRKAGPHGPSNATPHERRREIINQFFSRWRLEVGDNIYPALRLILPDKDRDRAMYGLKEKALAKILVRILKIDKNSEDAYNLINWKRPGQTSESAGDFAGRVYEVISKRALRIDPGELTIEEVNEKLGRLSVESKENEQTEILEEFYQGMNAEEMMWLIRIILRNMKVGATEKTFLEIWHPDAEALFNVCSSLRRVCQELYKPEVRLEKEDRGVSLMACYQPQLAYFNEKKQRSFTSMVASMKLTEDDQEFWIEEKLDGERMQLHMQLDPDDTEERFFSFWSRKAKDYTYLYGKSLNDPNGSLTRHLKHAFKEGVENIILDGEMITWDPELDVMVPFGSLKTAALSENKNPYSGGMRPFYRVFDILYLNNTDLTRYTLRDRYMALKASVEPVNRRIEILEHTIGTTAESIGERLQEVVEKASEGLVLKNPRSSYKLNERNDDWVKVKPEYMNEFGESLDCIIIGGYYGSGHRGGSLSSFLCGLRDDRVTSKPQGTSGSSQPQSEKQQDEPCKFLSFFKVGGGMARDEYRAVHHQTEGKWHDWDPKKPPSHLIELAGGLRQAEKPDRWIHPKDSLVVEVKAASVNPTEDYATGVTLRFPRFTRFRPDKDWESALSLQEFRNLRETVEEQHEKNKKIAAEEAARRRPDRVLASRSKKPLTVAGYNAKAINNATKVASEREHGEVFKGLTLFVMTESTIPYKRSKLEIEELVKANGGRIVQNADVKSTEDKRLNAPVICIAERRTVKVASLIKRGLNEVVKPIWIFDCIDQAKADFARGLTALALPYEPDRHLFFTPDDRKEITALNVDAHGDSYARDTTLDELKQMMSQMKKVDISAGDDRFIDKTSPIGDDPEDSKGNMFARLYMYFHTIEIDKSRQRADSGKDTHKNIKSTTPDTQIDFLKRKSQFAQATIVETMSDPKLTHVVVFFPTIDASSPTSTSTSTSTSMKTTQRQKVNEEINDLRKRVQNSSRQGKKIPRLVSAAWIEKCWDEGTRVDEERFVPLP